MPNITTNHAITMKKMNNNTNAWLNQGHCDVSYLKVELLTQRIFS